MATTVVAPVNFTETVFEHCLSFMRSDDKHVEMGLIHLPGRVSVLGIAIYTPDADGNIPEPEQQVELSLEEARYLYALLDKLDKLHLLDK